ncbi:peptidylprolyl isomerase [Lysinibacillus sp. NPDC097195]|uniref:peptidylprolyl isomerase n=1 Tax=Lysinibacillus sp. NPDC097195 TaxID=3364141 RepID=UPI00380A4E3D
MLVKQFITYLRNEGLKLRRLFSIVLVAAIILAACNSTELSITEIHSVPTKVQERINTDYTSQLIHDIKKGDAYIIFQSTGIVTAQLEVRENILTIILDSASQENNALKQYVFKINRGNAEYDTINFLVNGKEIPFDNGTGF